MLTLVTGVRSLVSVLTEQVRSWCLLTWQWSFSTQTGEIHLTFFTSARVMGAGHRAMIFFVCLWVAPPRLAMKRRRFNANRGGVRDTL